METLSNISSGLSASSMASKISSAFEASQLSTKPQKHVAAILASGLILLLVMLFALLFVLVSGVEYHTTESEEGTSDFPTKLTWYVAFPTTAKTSSFSTNRTQSLAVPTGTMSAPVTTSSSARKEETTTHPGKGETSTTPVATTSTSAMTTMTSTTTTTRRSIPVGSLVCTVGAEALTPVVVLPEDGLCSYLFFDSLFTSGAADFLNTTSEIINGTSPSHGGGLKVFIERARTPSQTTEYGLGFSGKKTGLAQVSNELTSPGSTAILKELYNQRIHHYGFIDITITYFVSSNLKDILLILKRLAAKMASWSTAAHPALTWVAAPFGRELGRNFKAYISTFVPDVLLFSGHRTYRDYSKWTGKDCHIAPPINLDPPAGVSLTNHLSLRGPQRAIKESYPAGRSSLGVRVPLYARFYTPTYPDNDSTAQGNYSFFHFCTRKEDLFDYPLVQLCNDPLYANTSYDSLYDAEFSFNKAKKRFFTYDSIRALRNKLCKFKKDLATIPFNLAVANIEHEDSTGECGHGAFYRLRFLKRLATFFRDNFTSPDALDDCLRLE